MEQHDVRVHEPAPEVRLAGEQVHVREVVVVLRQEPLDGDPALETAMPESDGLDHLGHAAAGDGPDETVTLRRVHGPEC